MFTRAELVMNPTPNQGYSEYTVPYYRPKIVFFTRRAYTAILSEVLRKTPEETGGILLGYRDDVKWTVVESLDPGPNSVHQLTFFEYDQPYTTHLVNRVRHYYERPLELLGLWHRHPGSFDCFSRTDDVTNFEFAKMSSTGVISGLINVDPNMRLTLRHVCYDPFIYKRVCFTVLNAKESELMAPLRDLDALTYAIESNNQRDSQLTDDSSSSVPRAATVKLSILADQINYAIRQHEEFFAVDDRGFIPWSEDRIADLLEALGSDSHMLGGLGIELSMRCTAANQLELIAMRNREQQVICQFILVPASSVEGSVICISGTTDSLMAHQYTPGFLQACISAT